MLSITQTSHLPADYDQLTRSVRMRLLDRFHAKLVWRVIAEARLELAKLIPKIANIGIGNVWQFNLDTCVMMLALYRALKKYSFSLPESVQIIYNIYGAYLCGYPLLLRLINRHSYFRQYKLETRHRTTRLVSNL